MAMRQRGSGTGRQPPRSAGVRPVFEDFKPISEWEQDDESHSLVLYLPGFMKEQIKVSTEGRNIIRVRGERLVAGNKWSRFQEDFQVPENCEMNSIRAKHQGGNLTITVPKKNVDKGTLSPKKPRETFSPKTTSSDTTLQKGQDRLLPQNSSPRETSELTDEKNMSHQKMLDDQREKNSITPTRDDDLVLQDIKLKEDHAPSNRQQTILPTIMVDKGKKNLEHREELPQVENAENMKFDKDEALGASKDRESKGKQTIHASEGDNFGFKMGNYKKKVKALTKLNEERQLLVNMGVAVLVIVALSVYVTYKFASGKAKS
ncbi:inactive protein RESTRICTED TEV MOVEMENT 2 [Dorcoceras hygrometricum]|uniref:Inactive protein RESTRICTED TEV MOVEMENT 2 n=1 Tax=Dorcoceras hygrometricum TaxID=472368 RepID=R4NRR6_9LAMI|nr:small heat shock protein 35.9 [Dorcoceras hygrometricum]KZV47306.1 inactive protein RESTRICTED TEV MOVEMENT 2 [Dorcoceras hygrometricum]